MPNRRFSRQLLTTAHRREMAAAYDAGFRPAPTLRQVQAAARVTQVMHWRVRIRPVELPHDSLTPPRALRDCNHDVSAGDAYEAHAAAWNAWVDQVCNETRLRPAHAGS
jgi:hypothetical protein